MAAGAGKHPARSKRYLGRKHSAEGLAGAKARRAVPITDGIRDLTGAVAEWSITRSEVDRVKQVEHLRLDLQLHPLGEVKPFAHAQVDVLEARIVYLVATQRAVTSAIRRDLRAARRREGTWVDPL